MAKTEEWYSVSWLEESYDKDFHLFKISGPFTSKKKAIKQECTNWCTGEPGDPVYRESLAEEYEGHLRVEPTGDHGEPIIIAVSQDKDSLPKPPWENG